ncbi:MAG: AMP-binding protein [Pseudomonadales bacterium]|nr:AMP-binding protein [Pseudomonadales bacterium]
MNYSQLYQQSIEQPETFWKQRAQEIDWYQQPSQILTQDENGSDRWFADGELNTAYLALDYHVNNGRAEQNALIYDSPVTSTVEQYTYRELRDQVALFAGVLREQGIEKGDRVIIYMPMVPQAVIAMLACARLGAIHSVVFGGFAARELAIRIDDAKPKLLLAASCGIEVEKVIAYKPLVDEALKLAKFPPQRCIILQRPQLPAQMIDGQDLDWKTLQSAAQPAEPVALKSTDPLYILYE